MLGKAHITIGLASAMTIMMPESIPAALPVIAGAAAGCLICDIDCDSPREKKDVSKHRILAYLIACAALLADYVLDGGMWRSLTQSGSYLWCAGVAGLVITLAFANVSSHRGFSHSLIAMALETGFLYLIFPQAAIPFAAAFASHLVLDLTNKRPVRLFYPAKKGFCLGLYYADRIANRVCAAGGTLWLVLVLLICCRQN